MSDALPVKEYDTLEITKFKRPKDIESLKKNHVAFTGSPRKHPYDPHKVVLVSDPYSRNNHYYEFKINDIAFVEELANLSTMEEEIIPMVRIWVRKNSVAVRCIPFLVADLQ
jgi:inorganic pyrophosphatase